MIDYLFYVKKQYSKEKEYERFLVGLTILMLIGYLITGDNLNLLFIFGGLSIMYIFGIPFITYRRERKQGIVEKKKEYIKKDIIEINNSIHILENDRNALRMKDIF